MQNKYDHLINKYRLRFFDERLEGVGLSGPVGGYLIEIDNQKSMRLNTLIEKFPFHKSHATRAIIHLSDLGYIVKTIDPTDARGYVVSITPLGEQIAHQVIEAIEAWEKLVNSALTSQEIDILQQITAKIYRKLEPLYEKDC
jgi:DNA-binding MarR family transcriptional regulator